MVRPTVPISILGLFAAFTITACYDIASSSESDTDADVVIVEAGTPDSSDSSVDGGRADSSVDAPADVPTDPLDNCETGPANGYDDAGRLDLGCGCVQTLVTQKHCYGHEHPDFGHSYGATCTSHWMSKCVLDRGVYCCP